APDGRVVWSPARSSLSLNGQVVSDTLASYPNQSFSRTAPTQGTWQVALFAYSPATLWTRVAQDSFQVGTAGAPNIEVSTQSPVLRIVDGRTTPIDFNTTNSGPADQTFTIANGGTANLHVSNITLPRGFTLSQGLFPADVAPGSTRSFTIHMDSAATGP